MPAWTTIAVFVAAVFAAALSGAFFKPDDWYRRLSKPSWNPPDWVFAPAWTVLYLMIAYVGALVWEAGGGWSPAIVAWVAQLVLNAAWSYFFFGRHRIDQALVDAIGMVAAIVAFIALAAPLSPLAAWLFVPYLAWVVFAASLTAAILRRNPANGAARAGA